MSPGKIKGLMKIYVRKASLILNASFQLKLMNLNFIFLKYKKLTNVNVGVIT